MSLRRVGRSAAIYGLLPVLSRTVSFLMLPVYTRYLTTADYGILQLLGTTVEIISILFMSGAIAGVNRFYFKTDDEAERKRLLSTAWQMHCLLAMGGGSVLLLSAPLVHTYLLKGEGSLMLVRIASLNLATSVLATVPQLRLQLLERASLHAGSSLTRLLVQLSLNIVFVVALKLGVLGPLLSTLITNVALGGVLAFLMLRETGWHWDSALRRKLLDFGKPARVTALGSFLLNFGDRYFLAASWTTAVVGLYGVAYQFGFGFGQFFVTPLAQAWDPIRYRMGSLARSEWEPDYLRVFGIASTLYLTGFAAIGAFINPALQILTTPAYYPAAKLVPVIVSAYLFQAWTASFVYQMNMAERPALYTKATGVAIFVALVLYATLIPKFGAGGAAWATTIAFGVRCGMAYRAAQMVWPISYRWTNTTFLAVLAIAVNIASLSVSERPVSEQLGIGSVLLVVFLSIALMLGMNREDRATLLGLVMKACRRPSSSGSSK